MVVHPSQHVHGALSIRPDWARASAQPKQRRCRVFQPGGARAAAHPDHRLRGRRLVGLRRQVGVPVRVHVRQPAQLVAVVVDQDDVGVVRVRDQRRAVPQRLHRVPARGRAGVCAGGLGLGSAPQPSRFRQAAACPLERPERAQVLIIMACRIEGETLSVSVGSRLALLAEKWTYSDYAAESAAY